LNSGTLRLRNDSNTVFANNVSLSAASTIDVNRSSGAGAATLTLGTLAPGANTLTVTGTSGATLAFAAVTLSANTTFNTASANVFMSAITGAFGFTKSGTSTLTLTGTNTYSGATTV